MKNLGLASIVAMLAVYCGIHAFAADILVDEGCSLPDAIRAANTDEEVGGCSAGGGVDVINLGEDVLLGAELPQIASTIVIKGNNYSVNGQGEHRIFYVLESGMLRLENVTISHGNATEFTLTDGDTVQHGGGIYNEGIVIVTNSEFQGNSTGQHGGAIYNNSGDLAVSHSTFSDNSSAADGAAIYTDGSLAVADCVFVRNSAAEDGGAIKSSYRGTVSVSNSMFSNNSASWGGAIYDWFGYLDVQNSTFAGNNADRGGALVSSFQAKLSVDNSSFSQNSARQGGAIYAIGESLIAGSTFSNNLALAGGAIYGERELRIVLNAFSNNSAFEGGAIHNNGNLNLHRSTFRGNSADTSGGAILNGLELSVTNSSFTENLAFRGGAIHSSDDGENQSKVELTHVTLVNNSAELGGGVLVESMPADGVNLYNSIVANNSGSDCMGVLNNSARNLIEDGSCDAEFSGDPILGELVEPEDGSPAYFPLLAGSPAIDAASSDFCADTDQIGTARPQGEGCDIGAIEFIPEN